MIAHIFKGIGRKVGMTSTDGVVVDERLIIRSDASGPRSAKMVLQNPRVDFAVFEVARGGILREGLGYERNDVGVVLNVQPDHLGLRGHRHPGAAGRRQGRRRRGRAPQRVRGAQRRRPAGPGHAQALLGPDLLVHHGRAGQRDPRHGRRPLPARRPGRGAGAQRAGRHDRDQAGPAVDAAGLDPPAAGDLRRPGHDERAERAWPPPPRPSPPGPRCTTSGRACGPSPPTTTWPPDG